ncbi:MAG: DNA-processing protein DprA [Burkholderiales bacterium]
MGRDELAAWLRLLETPGIGRLSARRLLAAFGSPQAVFEATLGARQQVVDATQAHQLALIPTGLDDLVARTWQWLQHDAGHALLTLGDPLYPPALLTLTDPPLLIYCIGRLDRLLGLSVAVVGSRNPSAQGIENARLFSADLSRAGLVVVSGLAMGIDGAAHDGALQGPAGTIAVVGTGLDQVYPSRHRALAQRIAADGLILSEFALGTPPLSANFPQRNRVIAGLTLGTLVVEAALRSGSLITARLASESGREVFAIPGSIHAPQSRGCHALIKQGAKLVESTQDILDELLLDTGRYTRVHVEPPAATSLRPLPHTDDEQDSDPVLRALGHGPATFDTLQLRTGCSASDLNVQLLSLELSGRIERLPGQVFQRLVRA